MITNFTYKPRLYFLLTFAVTFVLWFSGAYFSYQEDGDAMYLAMMLPGLMAPFLISLVMLFLSQSQALKKDFWNRLINPKLINLNMLPVLFLIMPVAVLCSIGISLAFGGTFSQLQFAEEFSFSSGMVPVLLLLIMAASFEELGWRGYAFDSLQSRYTYFTASVVFSVLWSAWHFPLLFVKDSYQFQIYHQNVWYAVNFFVSIIPMGIIISWICIKNNKSVLAAILFHFVINMSQEALGMTQITKCIETFVLFGFTIAIVVYDKDLFFSKKHLLSRTKRTPTHQMENSLDAGVAR